MAINTSITRLIIEITRIVPARKGCYRALRDINVPRIGETPPKRPPSLELVEYPEIAGGKGTGYRIDFFDRFDRLCAEKVTAPRTMVEEVCTMKKSLWRLCAFRYIQVSSSANVRVFPFGA